MSNISQVSLSPGPLDPKKPKKIISQEEIKFKNLSRHDQGIALRGHIVKAHFQILTLSQGIPVFDLEKLHHDGHSPNWIIKKIKDFLSYTTSDFLIKAALEDKDRPTFALNILASGFSLDQYKELLVKTLKAIEIIYKDDPNIINWEEIETIYPGARNIQLNFSSDTYDGSYFVEEFNQSYPEYWGDITQRVKKTNVLPPSIPMILPDTSYVLKLGDNLFYQKQGDTSYVLEDGEMYKLVCQKDSKTEKYTMIKQDMTAKEQVAFNVYAKMF